MSNNIYDETWKSKMNAIIKKYPNCYLREFVNANTNLNYRTLFCYASEVGKFVESISKPVGQIGFDDYANYIAEIRDLTPSAQIVIYSALKKYNRYLYISGKAEKNYMENIDRPNATERQSTISKREKGFLSDDEIPKFLNNVRESNGYREAKYWKERDMCLAQLFLNTGLRCSGLWKIDVDDIDIDNKILVTTEKRGKVRTYTLTDELVVVINAWLKERERRANADERALFVSEKGTRMSTHRMAEIVRLYAKNINGKTISPHKLRATFGTQVYNATGDIYLTQQVMGHKSPITTELYIRGQMNKSMATAADIMRKVTLQSFA